MSMDAKVLLERWLEASGWHTGTQDMIRLADKRNSDGTLVEATEAFLAQPDAPEKCPDCKGRLYIAKQEWGSDRTVRCPTCKPEFTPGKAGGRIRTSQNPTGHPLLMNIEGATGSSYPDQPNGEAE